MKRFFLALIFALGMTGIAYAACSTQTFFIDGKVVICTTCCDRSGSCNTFCT